MASYDWEQFAGGPWISRFPPWALGYNLWAAQGHGSAWAANAIRAVAPSFRGAQSRRSRHPGPEFLFHIARLTVQKLAGLRTSHDPYRLPDCVSVTRFANSIGVRFGIRCRYPRVHLRCVGMRPCQMS